MRREEVAELAGIGVDWYVRLEQGRTVSPSDATLDALASYEYATFQANDDPALKLAIYTPV